MCGWCDRAAGYRLPQSTMFTPWLLLLISVAASEGAYENSENTTINDHTILYPTNKTIDIHRNYNNYTETQEDIKTPIIKENVDKENKDRKVEDEVITPKKESVTTWTIETNYAQPKNKTSHAIYAKPENKESEAIRAQTKDIKSESIHTQPIVKNNPNIYSQSNDKEIEDSNSTDSKEQSSVERPKSYSDSKEFKPSPHLGSFFDDENLNILKFSTSDSSIFRGKKPAIDLLSSKDFYMVNYKSPKDTYRDQLEAPYRYEGPHFLTSNDWKQTLDSKPTVESSVKIPAGGLYKHSNPFKEKPSSESNYDDFGLSYSEHEKEKENPVKKRAHPWKSLLQVMTAFLPVGLIISALTPSIITLHSTDNNPHLGVGRGGVSRRADGVGGSGGNGQQWDVPAISERCRRRLLCEIHADENYLRSQDVPRPVRKHCYKLRCEDPDGLRRVLAWLLAHRPRPPQTPHRPGPPRQTDQLNYHHRSDDFT